MKFRFLLLLFALIFSSNVFGQVPDSPVLTEPPDLDVVVPLTPLLDWTDVSGATGYILEISTSPSFVVPVSPLPAIIPVSEYQVPAGLLLPNTLYYWRVKAVNAYGSSPYSSVWRFRTAGTPIQEIGHLSDYVLGLVPEILPWNQANILINWLESATHQLQLQHEFVAKLHLMLFKLRVLVLRYSHILQDFYSDRLMYVADKIIALINDDSGVTSEGITVNNNFKLGQNYPNPFNPTTAIEYTIPEKSHVALKVYDMLGKEAATLVDNEQEQGSYIVIWNASNFSSGVYFYKLTSGNYIETKRMILKK